MHHEKLKIKDMEKVYENLLVILNKTNTDFYSIKKEFSKIKYVILKNSIFDISDFDHPGGIKLLFQVVGKEIGRYYYGSCTTENLKIESHPHTNFATSFLEKRFIGEFQNNFCKILYVEKNEFSYEYNIWTLKEKRPYTEQVNIFFFSSNIFKVKILMPGVEWLGRYFYIVPFGADKQVSPRPYSLVTCFQDENIVIRMKLIAYFNKVHSVVSKNDISSAKTLTQDHLTLDFSQMNLTFSDRLCFLVKHIKNSSNVSHYLHNCN